MASDFNPNGTLSVLGWNIMQDGVSASSSVDIPAFLWSVADSFSAYLQLPILNVPYINLIVDGRLWSALCMKTTFPPLGNDGSASMRRLRFMCISIMSHIAACNALMA